MATSSMNLRTSSRSGHPIFPTGNPTASNYQPPSCEPASDSPPGVDILPQGTWMPVKNGCPSANIEVLDLSDRFGYNPNDKSKAKARPKNALKKGIKPTWTSGLPLKRTVHEISSDDEETVSDPSPLRGKRPRLMDPHGRTDGRRSALEELRAAAEKDASPILTQVSATKPKAAEGGLAEPVDNPRSESNNEASSANSGQTSTTELGDHKVDQPNITGTRAPTTTNIHGAFGNTRAEPASVASQTATAGTSIFGAHPAAATTTRNPFPGPDLHRYAITRTALRVYIPRCINRVYVPLKLRSVSTLSSFFAAIDKILEPDHRDVSILTMHFDRAPAGDRPGPGNAWGTMAVKKGVESSWECFLDEVAKRGCIFEPEIGVGVEIVPKQGVSGREESLSRS